MKKRNKIFMVIYVICMVVFAFFLLAAQDMGKNILRDELVKSIILVVCGGACFGLAVYRLIDLIKCKGGYSFKEIMSEIVLGLVLGILVLLAGVWNISDCIKDMNEGYEVYYIEDTNIEYSTYQDRTRTFSTKNNYTLSGRCDGELIDYNVYNTDFPENLRDRINQESPDMIIYYYPHSRTIAQIQIQFESGVRIVPQGEEPMGEMKVDAVEEESDVIGYEAPKNYEEVTVSEATDITINVGDYSPDIVSKLCLDTGGWYSQINSISLKDEEKEEIKTYFELTDEQSYGLYKNSKGYVIVLIYGKADLIIQDVRAYKVVE